MAFTSHPTLPWSELHRRLSGRPASEDGKVVPLRRSAPEPVQLPPVDAADTVPWAELHVHSAFSFLDGASEPEPLAEEAARLGIETLALTDHDGFYGAVRFADTAKEFGLRTVFGAELTLSPDEHLLVLARSAAGYRRLSAAVSAAQLRGGAKNNPVYDFAELAEAHGGEWAVLTGCRKGRVPAALAADGPDAALRQLHTLTEAFGRDNVHVELIDQRLPGDDLRNDALAALAAQAGLPVIASNNVHHAHPAEARLAQSLAALHDRRTIQDAAGWTMAAGTAHLRSGREMAARLARFPGVREATVDLARACAFDFCGLEPRLPGFPVPDGHTETSHLRALVVEAGPRRFGADNEAALHQLARELDVIEQLDLAGYFLIVHDIVDFCRREDIWCQGRGSAANSAVCFALEVS